jgi:hypothetical protein
MKKTAWMIGGFAAAAGAVLYLTGTPFPLWPGYSAKELCSCLFVLERDLAYCQENAVEFHFPAISSDVDDINKEVRVKNLFRTAVARFAPGHFGCQLVQ